MKSVHSIFLFATTASLNDAHSGNQTFLLIGGYDSSFQISNQVIKWPGLQQISGLPVSVFDPESALLDGVLFVCGGQLKQNMVKESNSRCFVLGEGTQEDSFDWVEVPKMTYGRRSFSINRVGDVLVAAGGLNSSDFIVKEVEIFEKGYWRILEGVQIDRYFHCAVTYSETEVLFLGGSKNAQEVRAIQKLNVKTGEVVDVADLVSDAGVGVSCVLWNNSLVYTDQTKVEALNLETLEWRTLPPLNKPRYCHTMSLVDGNPAVFGGYEDLFVPAETVEILEEGVWVEYPGPPVAYHSMAAFPSILP